MLFTVNERVISYCNHEISWSHSKYIHFSVPVSVSFFVFPCSKEHSVRAYLDTYYLNDLSKQLFTFFMTGLITSLGFTSSSEQVWRGTYWHSLAIVSEGYSLTMSLQTSFGTSWQYSWNLYKHTLMTNTFKVQNLYISHWIQKPIPKFKTTNTNW